MKVKLMISCAFRCALLLFSASAGADYSCSYDLRLGVVTGNDQVRIMGASRTLYQINNQSKLFVNGKLVKLSTSQKGLVQEYANGMEIVVPEITLLAKEGVSLVTDNITRIYSGLVGQNSDTTSDLYASMKKVKERVREKFGHTREYYFINPGKLEVADELEGTLQAQIESGFSNVSGILTAIGTLDASESSDDEDNEEDYALRKRARITCKKLKRINSIETALHQEIPALKKMDVVINLRQPN